MNCPRCYQDHDEGSIKTPVTKRGLTEDYREHRCAVCGLRWSSVAKICDVFVYDPKTMKEAAVPSDDYMKMIDNAPAPRNGLAWGQQIIPWKTK